MAQSKKKFRQLLKKGHISKSKALDNKWKRYASGGMRRGKECVEVLIEWASISIKGKKVLVVGCGTGGEAIAFAQKGADVTAIDIDPRAIKLSSVRAEENGVRIKLKREDICHTSFSSASFDLVILWDSFEHLMEPERGVQEISRVLKPEGKVFLNPPSRFSAFNILEDPHYHLFGVAVLPRKWASYYVIKVRKLVDEYELFCLPTLSYVYKVFSKYGVKMTNVSLDWKIKEFVKKLDAPNLIISPKKRRVVTLLLNLRIKSLLFWFGKFFLKGSTGLMRVQYLLGTKR